MTGSETAKPCEHTLFGCTKQTDANQGSSQRVVFFDLRISEDFTRAKSLILEIQFSAMSEADAGLRRRMARKERMRRLTVSGKRRFESLARLCWSPLPNPSMH